MSTADELDTLLYAWLSEPEAQKAELRFGRYFQTAFPAICRFVRSMGADPASAQDIAQQALIKLFSHLGTERRAADQRIRQAVSELQPLEFGPLHVRRVESWRGQVGSFRDAASGFPLPRDEQRLNPSWKDLRAEINERIPPLTRQGGHLIGEARTRVEPKLTELLARESTRSESSPTSVGEPLEAHPPDATPEESIEPSVQSFVATLMEHARGRDDLRLEAALGCRGLLGFVTCTNTVCACLPALAIPTNGLLYTIAKRQLLDRFRARRLESSEQLRHLSDGTSTGVLEELELADGVHADAADERDTEVETRYRAFLEFLRAPLTRAEAALALAAGRGKAKAEQARVSSLRAKYERVLAVLSALRQDPQPTEEEIARREGLTRNQVKYVIERIREEFNQFFPDLAREAEGRRKQQGTEC